MKMTKEENQVFADEVLTPVLMFIDTAIRKYDIEKLKESLKDMKKQTSLLAAWPTPETMRKAEKMAASNELFETIVDLIEIRKKQMEIHGKGDQTVGADILKHLGY